MTDQAKDHATPDADHLLDHAYDGIQEYDNPLPRWWLALFWATIIFTPLYILYFHFGGGMLAKERYDQEMIAFYDKQAEQLLALGEITENTLVDLMADARILAIRRVWTSVNRSPLHAQLPTPPIKAGMIGLDAQGNQVGYWYSKLQMTGVKVDNESRLVSIATPTRPAAVSYTGAPRSPGA